MKTNENANIENKNMTMNTSDPQGLHSGQKPVANKNMDLSSAENTNGTIENEMKNEKGRANTMTEMNKNENTIINNETENTNAEGKKKGFITKKRVIAVTLAAVIAVVGFAGKVFYDTVQIIEEASVVDAVLETVLEEEETPLAAEPVVTVDVKTNTKETTKTVWMTEPAKYSGTKSLTPVITVTSKTVQKDAQTKVKTTTKINTKDTEQYFKKSKKKLVTTKVTTTITTTTTVTPKEEKKVTTPTTVSVKSAASKMPAKVTDAFNTLGMTVIVDPKVTYSGYFSAKDKSITLRENNDTIYHELGHFLGFIAGNYDTGSEFTAIFNSEKGAYTGYNKAYVLQNSAEYFAESVRDYVLNPSVLKSARPKTYAAVESAW